MSSILLLGNGGTNKYLDQINRFSSSQVKAFFLGTKLKLAYEACKDQFDEIYLANVKNKMDYIEVAHYIDDEKYDYICPLELYAADRLLLNEHEVPAAVVFADIIQPAHAQIILSDLYATAFTDAAAFTAYYNQIGLTFQNAFKNKSYSQNIILIANHFKKTTLAQVAFVIDSLNSPPNVYLTNTHGNSYYDLAVQDFYAPIVFIKNNTLIDASYENLVNFYPKYPGKLILIQNLCRFLKDRLTCNFIGKRYTGAIIIAQIKSSLSSKLEALQGVYLEKYIIKKIDVVKELSYYNIIIYLSIVPYLYTETFDFTITKKV